MSTRTETPPKHLFGAKLVTPLVAGALLNPINSTLIAVALVPIAHTFGARPEQTAWLITSLYLATAVGQPVVGLLVDRFGARRVLLCGAVIVLAAGIAGMLAFSLGWLIAVRAVLGLGTCAGFPAAMAVLRKRADAAGEGVPSRTLSVLAMSSQTVMVIGPTLGGLLIGLFGWPAIFAVNIPLALASLLLALFWVPKDDPSTLTHERIDFAGIVLFSVTLLIVLLFVMEPHLDDSYLLAVAVVFAAAFAWSELHAKRPFIDLRTLAGNGPLLRTYLRQALAFLIVYSIMFGYVQWLEAARGMSEEGAGAFLIPMSGVAIFAAAAAGRPTGVFVRLILNSLALLAGSALLLFIGDDTWFLALLGMTAVFGLGQGLTSVTNQTVLYGQAPADQIGTASGLFRTAQYLGAIAASTLIALCFGAQTTSAGLHHLAWMLCGAGVVLFLLTAFDRNLRAHGKRA